MDPVVCRSRDVVAEVSPVLNMPSSAASPAWSKTELRVGRAFVVLGIALRLALYLANRSLWVDEANLAVNLVARSFRELCLPLDYEQGAPLGFLFLERTAVLSLGESEFSLRLVPLLSGILFLELCFRLVRRFFGGTLGLAALAMAVFSKSLIHFSVELKQYASDAMLALLILYCAMRVDTALERKAHAARAVGWFAMLGAATAWFSHPAIFVAAGTAGVLAVRALYRGQFQLAVQISAAAALAGINAFCHYFFFARGLTRDPYLLRFWAAGMMPVYPPLHALRWLCEMLPKSLEGLFGSSGIALTIFLFLLGCISLWRSGSKTWLGLLLAPALVTLAASAMHQYPFSDRLIVFLFPLLIIVLAAGFDGLYHRLPRRWNWIALILLAGVLAEPSIVALKACFEPPLKEEMKPVLAFLHAHRQSEDVIYIAFRGRPNFEYYAHRYGFDPTQAYLGHRPFDPKSVQAELAPFLSRPRVWILRTTINEDAEHELLAALAQLGAPLQERASAKGVRLDLYDLSGRSKAP